jgi:hypothetical protein
MYMMNIIYIYIYICYICKYITWILCACVRVCVCVCARAPPATGKYCTCSSLRVPYPNWRYMKHSWPCGKLQCGILTSRGRFDTWIQGYLLALGLFLVITILALFLVITTTALHPPRNTHSYPEVPMCVCVSKCVCVWCVFVCVCVVCVCVCSFSPHAKHTFVFWGSHCTFVATTCIMYICIDHIFI